jgi:hypothetical protein
MAGPLGGAGGRSDSGHHQSWRRRWQAPWGVLSASPAAATIGVGDVDGGPLGGCWRQIRQRPPPELETLMSDPLGGVGGRSGSGHHRSWRRRWRAPWGVLAAGPAATTTKVEDVDGGPPGGCWRQVRQRPPTKLETSMAGPWGLLSAGPAAATTEVEGVDGGPPCVHGDMK